MRAPQYWQNAMWAALAPRQRGQFTTADPMPGAEAVSPGSGEPQFAQKRPLCGLDVPQRVQRFSGAEPPKLSAGAAGRGMTSTRGGSTKAVEASGGEAGARAAGAAGGAAAGAPVLSRFPQS
jgi:hypothetical protein